MRWPWSRRVERRQGYTDAVVAALVSHAGAGVLSEARSTAALEAAAGAVSRGFAAATVEDAPGPVLDALTPGVLASCGRELIRRGEAVFLIDLRRGVLTLDPCGTWDIRGDHREADWSYRLDLFGPSRSSTRMVPSAGVVHVRYATDPARPWLGLSPMAWAALSGELHAGVTAALTADTKAAAGTVIPMPPGENADDEGDDPLAGLKGALTRARGKSVFVESTRGAFGADHRDAPREDWVQKRLGANPPEALAGMLDSTATQVLAACGVDPVLAGLSKGDGTLAREAYRRFERLTLGPLARIVTVELRDKLAAPDLSLNFDSLRASDFAGVARAYKALTEAGLSPDAAAGQLDMDL